MSLHGISKMKAMWFLPPWFREKKLPSKRSLKRKLQTEGKMISSHICQLSTKQQLMTALEIRRSKKLRDKKHSKSHRINSAWKKTENLKSKIYKAVYLRGRGKNASFPSHIVMASSPKKHCMCLYVFLSISLVHTGNKGKHPSEHPLHCWESLQFPFKYCADVSGWK